MNPYLTGCAIDALNELAQDKTLIERITNARMHLARVSTEFYQSDLTSELKHKFKDLFGCDPANLAEIAPKITTLIYGILCHSGQKKASKPHPT